MIAESTNHIVNILMISSIYVLVALGFALIFGVMRIMNFAHGAIYMIGGYVCYYLWVMLGLSPWASLPLTMLIMALVGLFIEKWCFRPFQRDFEKAIIMSIAIIIILRTGADLVVGSSGKGLPPLLSGVLEIGSVTLRLDRLLVLGICLVLFVALTFFVQRSKIGLSMLAIAQDRDAAALQGININRISAYACAMGSGLAGLAGGLVGSVLVLHVSMADMILVKIIAIVILAGIGNVGGIWLGGLIVGGMDALFPYYMSSSLAESLALGLIILILLIRPQGFFGSEV
ncbi:MAG: branched-chain amino acid ABC transporter permease [Clostridia bacterium]|nr:branched-chain amino acid ABC transporter permease [Clostridia bacterium]